MYCNLLDLIVSVSCCIVIILFFKSTTSADHDNPDSPHATDQLNKDTSNSKLKQSKRDSTGTRTPFIQTVLNFGMDKKKVCLCPPKNTEVSLKVDFFVTIACSRPLYLIIYSLLSTGKNARWCGSLWR